MKITLITSLLFILYFTPNLFGQDFDFSFFDNGRIIGSGQENGILLRNGNGRYVVLDEFSTRINKELEMSKDVKHLIFEDAGIVDWEAAFVSIGKMEGVRELRFINCKIEEIPNSIKELDNIEDISFIDCYFLDMEKVINQIAEMKSLNRFAIHLHNRSFTLPSNLILLKELKTLQVTGSYNIDNLFDLIAQMPKLTSLTLAHSTSYLQEFDFNKIKHIKEMTLWGYMNYEKVLSKMRALENLESLNIKYDYLRELPDDLGTYFPKLRKLEIESDKLDILPASLGQLKNLRTLTLYLFDLEYFPEEIFELRELRRLSIIADFELNYTDSLPQKFAQISKLEYLYCDVNFSAKQAIKVYREVPFLQSISLTLDSTEAIPASIRDIEFVTEVALKINSTKHLAVSFQNLAAKRGINKLNLTIKSEGDFELPASIGSMQELLNLRIYSNGGKLILPNQLGHVPYLKSLDITSDYDIILPDSMGQLQDLQTLSLAEGYSAVNNVWARIPASITACKSLKYLTITAVRIIPEEMETICRIKSLEVLTLKKTLLKKIPKNIGDLSNLRALIVKSNNFSKLPQSMAKLDKLELLFLEDNKFRKVPKVIGELSNLRSLEMNLSILGFNPLAGLPASFKQLERLRYLNLDVAKNFRWKNAFNTLGKIDRLTICKLRMGLHKQVKIPTNIGKLSQVKVLHIKGGRSPFANKPIEIPASIGQLSNVENLNINWEGIGELPQEITQLKKLNYFQVKLDHLWVGTIKSRTNLAILSELPQLNTLKLEGGWLNRIDWKEATFPALERLSLKSSYMNSIDNLFPHFPNLKELDISNNQIEEIPTDIEQAQKLQRLIIGKNPLTNFPSKNMYQLKYLTLLDFTDNETIKQKDGKVKDQLYDLRGEKKGAYMKIKW